MKPEVLDVVYRVIEGELLAILPGVPSNYGYVTCYVRVGQHGAASPDYVRLGRLATPDEYASLHRELSARYAPEVEFRVMKRINWGAVRDGWPTTPRIIVQPPKV